MGGGGRVASRLAVEKRYLSERQADVVIPYLTNIVYSMIRERHDRLIPPQYF